MAASDETFDFPVPPDLLPRVTPDNRAYWEATARGELVFPQCRSCGRRYLPMSPRCPACLSGDIAFTPAEKRGTIASWVRYHKSYFPWTEGVVPYVVALLDIVPGIRMPMLMRPHSGRDPVVGEEVAITFMKAGPATLPVCLPPG